MQYIHPSILWFKETYTGPAISDWINEMQPQGMSVSELDEIRQQLQDPKTQTSAREHLVLKHLYLSFKAVQSTYDGEGDLLDALQEGNIGLMRAAESFGESNTTDFDTHAQPLVRKFLDRYKQDIKRCMISPIPKIREYHLFKRAHQELEQKLLRKPTLRELAGALDMPEVTIENYQRIT